MKDPVFISKSNGKIIPLDDDSTDEKNNKTPEIHVSVSKIREKYEK